MATIEELQAQLAALTARVDVITTPPETYYTMQYQGETIDRLLSMAPDNLLDNVNFCNPVNQRGVSGTISTPGFFIDRWYLVSGSAQLTSAGLVLNGTMRQTREFAVGAPTTASALTTTGVVSATYDDSTKIFTLTGTGQTFITAKLELGDVSTVGYQNSDGVWVPSNTKKYNNQLLDCQRFFYRVNVIQYSRVGYGVQALPSTQLILTVPLPVIMRETPQLTVSGIFQVELTAGSVDVISASPFSQPGGIESNILVNTSSDVVGAFRFRAMSENAYIDFSSEL